MPKPFPDIAIATIANNTPSMNKAMLDVYNDFDTEMERLEFIDFLVSDRKVEISEDEFFTNFKIYKFCVKVHDTALRISFHETINEAYKFCFDNSFKIVDCEKG